MTLLRYSIYTSGRSILYHTMSRGPSIPGPLSVCSTSSTTNLLSDRMHYLIICVHVHGWYSSISTMERTSEDDKQGTQQNPSPFPKICTNQLKAEGTTIRTRATGGTQKSIKKASNIQRVVEIGQNFLRLSPRKKNLAPFRCFPQHC